MKGKLLRAIAVVVAILAASGAAAQAPAPTPQAQTVPQFTPQQLDQMLAPIALYPDGLLMDVLMAATYPLEVIEADRWLQEGQNASLKGDQLIAALERQSWDPSVKSLVPYPRVLHMMDSKLEWTERLGEAFLADQAAVMDSIQRLRRRARGSGALVSSPQAVVTTAAPEITIEPPSPEIVYVPVCDPSLVYGRWPYPGYPPDYFPGFFTGATVGAFGCGWFATPVIAPLWGWRRWNWSRHRIDIDRDKFAALNANRPPFGEGVWQHDPSHRHLVPYRDPALRAQFPGARFPGAPEAGRAFRGYPTGAAPQVVAVPRAGAAPSIAHALPTEIAPSRVVTVPSAGAAPSIAHALPTEIARPPMVRRVPPAYESFGRGPDVRIESERGLSSRMSPPTMAPGRFAPHFAPSGVTPHFAPSGIAPHFAPSGVAPHFAPAAGARIR